MSNRLDPDQAQQNIEPDLGPTVCKGHQQMTLLMTLVDKKPNARIFLLVDLQDFFFRFRVGGRKKKEKKVLKMTLIGHFQSFFFFRAFFFLISPEKKSKTRKVNQQSVSLNL